MPFITPRGYSSKSTRDLGSGSAVSDKDREYKDAVKEMIAENLNNSQLKRKKKGY